jgi:hypothetical protein
MPRLSFWKLFLVACIAWFAGAGVSIGHSEQAAVIGHSNATALTHQSTPQMCPAALGQTTRSVGPAYKRYLGASRSRMPRSVKTLG